MRTVADPPTAERDLLERLNRLSRTRSVNPEIDVDWNSATFDAEYESLYSAWSLLAGTGTDGALDFHGRATFVKYQQINLMLFTALVERHAIEALAALRDGCLPPALAEYVGHFIEEETRHSAMFLRTVRQIQSSMPGARPLPTRGVRWTLRWIFRLLKAIPGGRLRRSVCFTFFGFAEQVTIYAQRMVQSKIPRQESLIHQIWSCHARDEARHLAFDSFILSQSRLPGPVAWFARALAALCGGALSILLNANEVWIAQQLGLRLHLWELPALMRRTTAPFKRRVFASLAELLLGEARGPRNDGSSGRGQPNLP